jgi:hypothetical protein
MTGEDCGVSIPDGEVSAVPQKVAVLAVGPQEGYLNNSGNGSKDAEGEDASDGKLDAPVHLHLPKEWDR